MAIEPSINYSKLTTAEVTWVQDGSAGNIKLAEVSAPSGTSSGVAIIYVKSSDSNLYFQNDSGTETQLGSTGAPSDAQYVVLAVNGSLTNERVLTGTSGEIIITDGGAGANVVLSTPQKLTTTATVEFNTITVGTATVSGSAQIVGSTTIGTLNLTNDLAVTEGGTGASNAAGARTNLGLVIGTNVQAWDADLDTIAALTHTASAFIVSNGSTWVKKNQADARADLGLGTIATQDANNVSITGGSVTGITDITVADGGTGTSSIAAYRVICGGTTNTGVLQTVDGLGSSTQVLTSNGAGALPTWQASSGGTTPTASIQAVVFAYNSMVRTGDGQFFVHIDSRIAGKQLKEAHGRHINTPPAGIGTVVDVVNTGTSGTAASGTAMLSTLINIDVNESRSDTSQTAVVISNTGSAVLLYDLLRIDVDSAGSTTSAEGLIITLGFN